MIENGSEIPDFVQQIALLAADTEEQLNDRLRPLGLTAGNYFYLLKIGVNPGIMQREFTELIHVNASTVTRAVNHLIDQKLVDKKSHPRDGRATRLFLTDAGQKLAQKTQVVIDDVNKKLLDQTSKAQNGYDQVGQLRTELANLSKIQATN